MGSQFSGDRTAWVNKLGWFAERFATLALIAVITSVILLNLI
jgi:hypothetical protein